ncbi:U3 small nucleolar ribonucleoprotein complex, subunit Mpp10 [Dendryphion nanum]|uniref:U3 small nucleolar ribonucleoprotein protein MPP10 n=1 Tax=Dendryphion nanum TaxID=256645 RepID=A0A9P9DUE1_9PLEO|nr:U3 small nucleolar ribonucleoprotein complex, subunit Mpp10 [Dendryphion nanum]
MEIDDEEGIFSDAASDDEPAETYQPDPNGLNDGFFSIDDFNRQSEFFEQQDERGEPPASDDDEVDWDGDPFAKAAGNASNDDDAFSENESDEEGGPTFGNMDLNAPEGASDDEDDEDDLLEDGDLDGRGDTGNANNIMYADFFLPPPTKAGKNKNKNKNKKGRPHPHNFPSKADATDNDQGEEEEDDLKRTISAVQRDLFEDEDDLDAPSDAESLSDLDPSDPKSRRSTHERRQHKLAEQIRRLESENVAKRAWQLSGEVSSRARPMNSLLEEDLGFEHLGKPVPIITAEVSESIEALIKRRILASEFDEIHRRRPDDLATGPKTRRGQMDIVDDTKSSKPLGDLYEEEFRRQNDPSFVDARDEKLKKEHELIESLWKNVSAKLDSLSSWHYKPKPAAANLEIRVDAPVITMEDARPTAGSDVASASALAPQEVYKPGDEKTKGEVVTKGGAPIAREEMTREQKESARRRAKSRAKKRGLNEPAAQTAHKTDKKGDMKGRKEKEKEKKDLIGTLKKGGVQVIGKKGQVTDVEGKEVRERVRGGGGSLKL